MEESITATTAVATTRSLILGPRLPPHEPQHPEPIPDDLAYVVRHHRHVLDTVTQTLNNNPDEWFIHACRLLRQSRGMEIQRRIDELSQIYNILQPWFVEAEEMSEAIINATVLSFRNPVWMNEAMDLRRQVLGYSNGFRNILHLHSINQLKLKLQHCQLPSYECLYPVEIDQLHVFM